MAAATTPRNKKGLRIDGGAEAVLEIARISLQQQHFVDLADDVEGDSTKILSYESNTSSSSSDEEEQEPSDRRASFRNKNKVFLAKISLQDGGGVDSTPFTPSSKNASEDLISPFLDDEDVARALQQQSATTTGKRPAGTKRPLTIDLSKPRAVAATPAPAALVSGREDEDNFALERRELQSRARRAEKRLAFALMDSALRRRKNLLLRLFLRRWRLTASMAPNPHRHYAADDDAQVLANQLLKRLRELRS
ncbi:hypothetical protein BASA81_010597 [Batrachochytrium salamandrivorans]|nr:hypothetical protein BASA81_010597 [Batrachochytrium salamandrivorans]